MWNHCFAVRRTKNENFWGTLHADTEVVKQKGQRRGHAWKQVPSASAKRAMATQAMGVDGWGRPCAAAQPTSTPPAGSRRTAATHSGAVCGASTCAAKTGDSDSQRGAACYTFELYQLHSSVVPFARKHVPTFMATIDVPQKKKGEISRSKAPNCSSPVALVLTPATSHT